MDTVDSAIWSFVALLVALAVLDAALSAWCGRCVLFKCRQCRADAKYRHPRGREER